MKQFITYITFVLILKTNHVFAEIAAMPSNHSEDLNISSFLMILLAFILLCAAKWRNVNK